MDFLLSGGGNDLLDGGRLKLMLRAYRSDPAGGPLYKTAHDYIIMHRLDEYLEEVIGDYRDFFDVLTTQLPDLKIFCHGYDWMLLRFDGIYLWPTMQEREIKEPLRSAIIKVMVDLFNERLEQVAGDAKYLGNVIHVDCRNTVGNKAKWFDEIPPSRSGLWPCRRQVQDRDWRQRCKAWPDAAANRRLRYIEIRTTPSTAAASPTILFQVIGSPRNITPSSEPPTMNMP